MKKIPGRKRIPILTDLLEIRRMINDSIGYSRDMVAKYGDVCYVPIPGVKNYYVQDPDILKEVLVTQAGKFCKSRLYRAMKKFLGEGLFTSESSLHHRQRRLMAPAFHKQRIREYTEIMVQCALDETRDWQAGDMVNMSQAMTNITLQVVTKTLFGAHIESDVQDKVSRLMSRLMETTGNIFQHPLYLICFEQDIRIPIVRKFYAMKAEMDEIIHGIIASYAAPVSDRKDLLTMLMEARDEDTGERMSDEQIRDEVMVMFLAGHETTATALSWVWYLLGKHPDVYARFQEEVNAVLAARTPTAEDYANLPLAQKIFKETLRLYPPAWTLARETTEDVTIQGYHFPKGAVLCTLMYLMHRNEKYFHDPDAFIPDRWDEPRIRDLPRYAYFPFGGGSRVCIGEGFAWMEGVLIMATIAARFELELPHDFTTTINPVFTLRPKDQILMNIREKAG